MGFFFASLILYLKTSSYAMYQLIKLLMFCCVFMVPQRKTMWEEISSLIHGRDNFLLIGDFNNLNQVIKSLGGVIIAFQWLIVSGNGDLIIVCLISTQ